MQFQHASVSTVKTTRRHHSSLKHSQVSSVTPVLQAPLSQHTTSSRCTAVATSALTINYQEQPQLEASTSSSSSQQHHEDLYQNGVLLHGTDDAHITLNADHVTLQTSTAVAVSISDDHTAPLHPSFIDHVQPFVPVHGDSTGMEDTTLECSLTSLLPSAHTLRPNQLPDIEPPSSSSSPSAQTDLSHAIQGHSTATISHASHQPRESPNPDKRKRGRLRQPRTGTPDIPPPHTASSTPHLIQLRPDRDDRYLTSLITSCQSLRELTALFANNHERMTAVHHAAMLSQLTTMMTVEPGQLTSHTADIMRLIKAVLTQCDPNHMAPRETCTVLWALAKLRYLPKKDVLCTWTTAAFRQLQHFSAFDLANLIWSISRLGMKLRADHARKFFKHVNAKLKSFSPQSLAMVLYSAGILRTSISDDVLQRMTHKMQRSFPNLRPRDVSNTLWALATLYHAPSPEWLSAICTSSQPHLRSYSAQELSTVIWAFSKMQHTPSSEWMDSFYAATSAQLPQVKAQGLAMLLYALSTLGFRPPQQWLMLCLECVLARIRFFTPQGLTLVISGVAALGFHPGTGWLDRFFSHIEHSSCEFSSLELDMVRTAVQQLKYVRNAHNTADVSARSVSDNVLNSPVVTSLVKPSRFV